MDKKRGLILAFIICFVLVQTAFAEDVSETSGKGSINWTKKEIVFTGDGAPNLLAPNAASARLGAERAAELVALRNALEAIKGVKIRAGQTVGDKMSKSDAIAASVEGVVKGFIVKETRYYSDGGVQRDLIIPLDGILTQTILGDELKKAAAPAATPVPAETPKTAPAPTTDVKEKSKADLKAAPVAPAGPAAPAAPAEERVAEAKSTGLVVIAKGFKVVPVLAPKIIDQDGKDVYDVTMVEETAENGIASYTKDENSAKADKRVTDNPLVVNAIETPNSVDLVVSNADAAKIRQAADVLAKGRVVIVRD